MTVNGDQVVERNLRERALVAKGSAREAPLPRSTPAPVVSYRPQALAAKARGGLLHERLRIYPYWATWIVASCTLVTIAAFVAASILSVEVTSLGRGIMRASGPPRILATQVEGTVVSVLVSQGDRAAEGQEIARLESAATAAALLRASRKLELARRSLDNFRQHKKPLLAARREYLEARSGALQHRATHESSSVARLKTKGRSLETLRAEGLATGFDALENAERVAGAQREALRVREDSARLGGELATLDADIADQEWHLTMQVEEAELAHDSLKFALEASIIRAPIAGVVGSISARPGDALPAGAALGSVVPSGAPRAVVVYVPERDRAFIDKGAAVRVEVDQLPVWEFGALHGHVSQVASEIASERDLRDTLGDQVKMAEPMYRVDITLEDDAAYGKLRHRLRPESLVGVRFTLRERRIITILFEPLYRWLR